MRPSPGVVRWLSGSIILLVVLAWPQMASAHVTVDPTAATRGAGDVVLTFRVPNEQPTADVTGLRVQFPTSHPIAVVSPEATAGWTVTTKSVQLTRPIKTDDGTFTSVVSEVDWSGGSIAPGQFGEFSVLAQGLPDDTGQLVLRCLQQYGNGLTVAWIDQPSKGNPNPEHPAPVLTLTPPTASGGSTTAGGSSPSATAATGANTSVTLTATSKPSNWPAIVALIAAGFAVALSLMVLWLTRPSMREGLTEPDEGARVDPGQ